MLRSIVLFFLYYAPAFSQELFFNYRAEDKPFLNYYSMWNQFDSSAVMFRFGEVHFINETTRHNVPLSLAFPERVSIQDAGTEGVSSKLQGMARTESFTIPDEGEIRWFGQLQSFKTPCDLSGKRDEPNRPVPSWGVVDWTEFVVQLVDAQSDAVLAVLDSTGVKPTAGPGGVDTRYGTHADRVKHSAAIPASYAGKQVYVRISPRRYGPTPYGLSITRFKSWFNLLAEWDNTGTTQISLADTDSLRDIWFAGLIDYCDSVKAETGWLPDLHGLSFAKSNSLSTYHARYFDAQIVAPGDTVWLENHTTPSNAKRGNTQITGAVDVAPLAAIKSTAPNPVAGENAELLLLVGFDMGYRIELVSSDGRRLGNLWNGPLNVGQVRLTVPIPKNLANGTYLLLLERATGERVNEKTIVIAR